MKGEEVMERMLLTVAEAAEVLGVGKSTVYDLMRTRQLPSVKLGRLRRVPVADLDRFVTELAARSTGVEVAA